MTVLQIDKEKFKIVLTHTEVNLCFGSYERLRELGIGVRSAIKTLIKDIVNENCGSDGIKVQVWVAAKENFGAKIFLKIKCKTNDETVVHFENSENMTRALVILYKKGLGSESSLYKTEEGFRLILKEKTESLFVINEFARSIKNSCVLAERTREYGKPLAEGNAVEKYAKAFLESL